MEGKNYSGTITYQNGEWERTKTGRRGGIYAVRMSDPVKQVNRYVFDLKEFLYKKKIFSRNFRPWIYSMVVFTNPHVELNLNEKPPIGVVTLDGLCDAIRSKEAGKTKNKLTKNEINRMAAVLSKL